MGPRLFRRGNSYRTQASPTGDAELQWGHAFSDVEMDPDEAETVIGHSLQWGHAFSDVEIVWASVGTRLSIAHFNGATPFQTWKFGRFEPVLAPGVTSMGPRLFRRGNLSWNFLDCPRLRDTSMGPRLFRRGNACCTRRYGWRRGSDFNGATPFQTWK